MWTDCLTSEQVNIGLVARHSRTSGSLESRRQRLQRFIDFERQKDRRNASVSATRARLNSEQIEENMMRDAETELECDGDCPCHPKKTQQAVIPPRIVTPEDIRAADALCALRTHQTSDALIAMMEGNLQLLTIVAQIELRVLSLENDRMPDLIPMTQPNSNPNWLISPSETITEPYTS
jgi:hypothetical protein